MTTSTFLVASGLGNAWPSRTWWQTPKCSPSTSGVAEAPPGSSRSALSIGHPEAMEPATTYLMKSRRVWDMGFFLLGVFQKFLNFLAGGAGANPIPDQNQNNGSGKNHGGDGVDLRGDAAAQAGPDFEREGVFAADEEESDGDFVHR